MKPPHLLHNIHLIWLLLLAACSPTPVPANAPSTLRIAVPRGTEASALQQAVQVYQKTSGVSIQIESLGLDVYADRLAAVLLAGRSDYDLIYLSAGELPTWVNYHALQPFPLDTQSNLPESEIWAASLVFHDQLYALPAQPSPEVLFYRADLFQQAGLSIPRTWPEFLAAARALNAPPERFAVALAGSEGGFEFAAYQVGFCAQANCPQAASQAMALYSGLYHDGLAGPLTPTATRADVVLALKEGRAAMGVLPLTQAATLLGSDSPLAAAPLPGLEQTALGSLGVWAVPLRASHSQQAQQFALWLAGPEGTRSWALNGGIPASRAAAQDSQILKKAPYLSLLATVNSYQVPLPPTTQSETLWRAYHAAVRAALNGDSTPDAALQQFNSQLHAIQLQDRTD